MLYNVIEDHMSSRDINVLNAFINNFYMNGIDGMKKFDMNFAFQYLMENELTIEWIRLFKNINLIRFHYSKYNFKTIFTIYYMGLFTRYRKKILI